MEKSLLQQGPKPLWNDPWWTVFVLHKEGPRQHSGWAAVSRGVSLQVLGTGRRSHARSSGACFWNGLKLEGYWIQKDAAGDKDSTESRLPPSPPFCSIFSHEFSLALPGEHHRMLCTRTHGWRWAQTFAPARTSRFAGKTQQSASRVLYGVLCVFCCCLWGFCVFVL